MLLAVSVLIACGATTQEESATEQTVDTTVVETTPQNTIEIVETVNLKVYYPNFSRIDLVCGTMPAKSDTNVIFVAEAAFTAALLDSFVHTNIIGPHVSGGTYYKGCGNGYTTWFSYANGKAEFHTGLNLTARTAMLDKTAQQGGMAFTQFMPIYNNKVTNSQPYKSDPVNEYRCLCEDKEGRICIADGKRLPFSQFRAALLAYGMKHALYLDMGTGWNYSWYRDSDGKVHLIHDKRTKYTTNWVTFYK